MISVSTPELRVSFVDGQETATPDPGFVACGAGTAFPMEVTLEQIDEIFYRVKDAWFTGGQADFYVGPTPRSITAPTSAPVNRSTVNGVADYQVRGYVGIGSEETEILDPLLNAGSYADAFVYDADDAVGNHIADPEWWRAGSGVLARVFRGNRVAVVKVSPSDDFFAPTNKFFLEIEFGCYDYDPVINFGLWTRLDSDFFGTNEFPEFVCNYVLRLQSGDALCPVYLGSAGASGPYGGTDIIHEAKEWWPYAKNSPAEPVWNSATGVKL